MNLLIFFRDAVKPAFQPIRRKSQLLRLNSGDCSNEIEDHLLPWLLEDLVEDTPVLAIQ
jgi:hypothetical protein